MKNERLYFLVLIFSIILLTVLLRSYFLQYQGFYEPDGFYHFSVIRAAVNNNFVVPKILSISGVPPHPVTEPVGLYWITLFPYFILRFFGVSYYDVMRLIPLLFGVFDVIGAYYLSRFLSKDKIFGLLVMIFVAINYADILKTSALVYRGDTFVSAFLILALIFFIYIFKSEDRNKKLGFALFSGLSLSLCNIVWNGGAFAFVIYIISILSILIFSIVTLNKKIFESIKYCVFSILLWFLLVRSYVYSELIAAPNQQLIGISGIAIIFFTIIGLLIGYLFFNKNKSFLINSNVKRITVITSIIILVIIIIYAIDMPVINKVFINNGFVSSPGFVTASIQELSKPTFNNFLLEDGVPLLFTPMSIFMAGSSLFTNLQVYFWIGILLSSMIYLFLNSYDSESWINGKIKFKLDIKIEVLVLISYLLITAYLGLFVIRFESLVAIPLAIFSAYTLYIILVYLKKYKIFKIAFVVFLLVIIVYSLFTTIQTENNSQLGGLITPNLLNASSYIKLNTQTNSVFLTLWSDGSVVEGWGNRTSITDSVGALNGSKVDAFANWLFNDTPDYNFILNYSKKPNYILVRYPWLLETEGIFLESGINFNKSTNYSYLPMTNSGQFQNNTALILKFTNNQSNTTVYTIVNKTNSVNSFYYENGYGISPFEYTAFYNIKNNNFSIIKQTVYNSTNNQMLLIQYSDIQKPNSQINITGTIIMNKDLYMSNMIKLMYFCNNYSCLLNSNSILFKNFYSNKDSRVFSINYSNN